MLLGARRPIPLFNERRRPSLSAGGMCQKQENARPFVGQEKPNMLYPVCDQKTDRMLKWMKSSVRNRADRRILCPVWLMFVLSDGNQKEK